MAPIGQQEMWSPQDTRQPGRMPPLSSGCEGGTASTTREPCVPCTRRSRGGMRREPQVCEAIPTPANSGTKRKRREVSFTAPQGGQLQGGSPAPTPAQVPLGPGFTGTGSPVHSQRCPNAGHGEMARRMTYRQIETGLVLDKSRMPRTGSLAPGHGHAQEAPPDGPPRKRARTSAGSGMTDHAVGAGVPPTQRHEAASAWQNLSPQEDTRQRARVLPRSSGCEGGTAPTTREPRAPCTRRSHSGIRRLSQVCETIHPPVYSPSATKRKYEEIAPTAPQGGQLQGGAPSPTPAQVPLGPGFTWKQKKRRSKKTRKARPLVPGHGQEEALPDSPPRKRARTSAGSGSPEHAAEADIPPTQGRRAVSAATGGVGPTHTDCAGSEIWDEKPDLRADWPEIPNCLKGDTDALESLLFAEERGHGRYQEGWLQWLDNLSYDPSLGLVQLPAAQLEPPSQRAGPDPGDLLQGPVYELVPFCQVAPFQDRRNDLPEAGWDWVISCLASQQTAAVPPHGPAPPSSQRGPGEGDETEPSD